MFKNGNVVMKLAITVQNHCSSLLESDREISAIQLFIAFSKYFVFINLMAEGSKL